MSSADEKTIAGQLPRRRYGAGAFLPRSYFRRAIRDDEKAARLLRARVLCGEKHDARKDVTRVVGVGEGDKKLLRIHGAASEEKRASLSGRAAVVTANCDICGKSELLPNARPTRLVSKSWAPVFKVKQ